MKKLILTFLIILFALTSKVVWSDDFSKGLDAFKRGDYTTALSEWRLLATEQGHIGAQFNLGLMFDNGYGVPKDEKAAADLFTRAAEQGNASAQYNLGLLYESGYGVLQDNIYAHMWGNISALNEYEDGRKLRDRVEKKMTSNDISVAQKLARECEKKEYKGC